MRINLPPATTPLSSISRKMVRWVVSSQLQNHYKRDHATLGIGLATGTSEAFAGLGELTAFGKATGRSREAKP